MLCTVSWYHWSNLNTILVTLQQEYKKNKTLQMLKDVGMGCQKVCKQGRDDA